MIFSSVYFIFFFFPIVYFIYFILCKKSKLYSCIWLIISSFLFYSFLSFKSLTFLILSIFINFYISIFFDIFIKQKKKILIFGIAFNIVFLIFFKYSNFLLDIISFLHQNRPKDLDLISLVGISFFTFTQISFLIDRYNNKFKEKNIFHYVLFISFFPYVISGPVVNYLENMKNFLKRKNFSIKINDIERGIFFFTMGLSKKILVADPLGSFSNKLFSINEFNAIPTFIFSWLAIVANTLRLYFDFSGYSDMALGLACFFGMTIPFNFNSPLKAHSIINFWSGWHMSLTNYFIKYLYTPISLTMSRLAYNQNSLIQNLFSFVFPTIITFSVIGFWHGPSWAFAIFGLLHALLIIINRLWRIICKKNVFRIFHIIFNRFYWFITFVAISLSLVIFTTESVNSSILIYKSLFNINNLFSNYYSPGFFIENFYSILLILTALIIVLFAPNTIQLSKKITGTTLTKKYFYKFYLPLVFFLSLLVILSQQSQNFIYFKF